MARSSATLFGDGVGRDALVQLADRYGFTLAPEGAQPVAGEGRNVLVISKKSVETLTPWLSRPINSYLELIDGEADINPETLELLTTSQLCFSLATSTAFLNDCAALACEALVARGVLTPMRRGDLELSLHETVSNAIVHGNLSIQSNMKGDITNFAKFAQGLQEQMTSPKANLRVDVSASWDNEFLDVTVADKGKGYDASKLPKNSDPFAPAGRGLAIIRSLALSMNVTQGGRVTTLRFVT